MFRHAVSLLACLQVCVLKKSRDETAGRAIHLFFLVESLSVTIRYAEASRVEHVADFKTAQDALHLPSTRPLATQQTHPKNTDITHSYLHFHRHKEHKECSRKYMHLW